MLQLMSVVFILCLKFGKISVLIFKRSRTFSAWKKLWLYRYKKKVFLFTLHIRIDKGILWRCLFI